MSRVSVIIPVYNPGPYLSIAVESVIAQTTTDWEIIIVNDGSPEDVSYIASSHPAIRILHQENQGQSVARNNGIKHSTGEFIAFLDQDDVWLPSKLEKQLEVMQSDRSIGLCHTQFNFIDAKGQKVGPGQAKHQSYENMLQDAGICTASTVMVRRELLEPDPFNSIFEPAEDYHLWLTLTHEHGMGFVPSVEALYRKHDQNQTRNYLATCSAMTKILRFHKTEAKARNDAAVVNASEQGIKNLRPNFGVQAFDQCRLSLRDRRGMMFFLHLRYALLFAPKYTVSSIVRHRVSR